MIRRQFSLVVSLLAFLSLSNTGIAQKADASFTLGVASASDAKVLVAGVCLAPCSPFDTFETERYIFFAGTGAVRLANLKVVSLHLEVPVAFVPSAGLTEINDFGVRLTGGHLSSLFITPAIRVKLVPNAAVSPFVSAGGGWARYKADSIVLGNKARSNLAVGRTSARDFPSWPFVPRCATF